MLSLRLVNFGIRSFSVIAWLILLEVGQVAQAQEIQYIYDLARRLIGVVDPQGRTAIYEYDAVGNLLAIRRQDATGPVAITFVNPNRGTIGTKVEIFGTGFSATAAENQIAFNGVPASVFAPSANRLTTEVPSGAIPGPGPITVTTPLGSAVSPDSFTVIGITISPPQATLIRGTSQQFTATVTGAGDQRVTWSVNDTEGGTPALGTITSQGIYTAPVGVSALATVRVQATSVHFQELVAEAMVSIVRDPSLPACTVFWDGEGRNGLWQTLSNWSNNTLPGPADNVCIDAGSAITLSAGSHTINSLESDRALVISGGSSSLSIAAASQIFNAFTLSGAGALSGTGNLTIHGRFIWTGATMQGTGVANAITNANGGIDFGATGKILSHRTLNLPVGTATLSGPSNSIFMTNGAIINNPAGATFEATNDGGLSRSQGFISQLGGVTFNNQGTFRKLPGNTGTTEFSGVAFNNTGTVEVLSGTLRFSSSYTQTSGATILNGGALASTTTLNIQGGSLSGFGTITANVSNAGTVAPGLSPGILTISGNYTQTSGGLLNIEIGGLTAGSQFDQLHITGSATLDGTLNLRLINGFTPNAGDSFQIMSFRSRTGNLATINGLDIGGGLLFQVNFSTGDLTLSASPVP